MFNTPKLRLNKYIQFVMFRNTATVNKVQSNG